LQLGSNLEAPGATSLTGVNQAGPSFQKTARATINLDVPDEVSARGSLGTDGDSSLGIFFERDY